MADSPSPDFGGPWSETKLRALQKYLNSYRKVLKHTNFSVEYIDAFAGGGRLPIATESQNEAESDEQRYRHGSPLIALRTSPSFHRLHFIEKKPSSIARLKEQIAEEGFDLGKVHFYEGDANIRLQEICTKWSSGRRAVAFLDPFAMHLKWATIQSVARTRAIDMWLLFPAMAVNRMLPRSGRFTLGNESKLTEFFGCTHWKEHFYKKTDEDLFSYSRTEKSGGGFESIANFVKQRLTEEFAGGTTSSYLTLPNRRGAPIFFLFFACANPSRSAKKIALEIAQYIIQNP